MTPLEELSLLLRPAGAGLYLVSTGRDEQRRLAARLYGLDVEAAPAALDDAISASHLDALVAIGDAKVVVLGVPSDVGAGYRRGASLAPAAIRAALLEARPSWPSEAGARGVLDLGDVFVVPQLLHDEMLSGAQRERSQDALYPNVPTARRRTLPVSPLSMAERALDLVLGINPNAKPFVLGGDHSVAWPVTAALHRHHTARGKRFAIVQPDAHTDLLEERLGVKYCFATWSFHANELIGRSGRLVQLGVRASRFERSHWESTLGVRQFWPDSYQKHPRETTEEIMRHLHALKVDGVYLSNDIDGTDAQHAPSTGTPEPNGLEPEWLLQLIDRIAREIGLVAADLVEVAPPLGSDAERQRTLALSARYMAASIDALLAR